MKLLRYLAPLALLCQAELVAADDCQPATWSSAGADPRQPFQALATFAAVHNGSATQPGEVNCRNWSRTYADVNYYTCTYMAKRWGLTVDRFLFLNPMLEQDCSNIKANTNYCVKGCE